MMLLDTLEEKVMSLFYFSFSKAAAAKERVLAAERSASTRAALNSLVKKLEPISPFPAINFFQLI